MTSLLRQLRKMSMPRKQAKPKPSLWSTAPRDRFEPRLSNAALRLEGRDPHFVAVDN